MIAGAALSGMVLVSGCSGTPPTALQATKSATTSARPLTSSRVATSTSSSVSPAPNGYRAGQTMSGGEFASSLLDVMQDQTFEMHTVSHRGSVWCLVDGSPGQDFILFNPPAGIQEVRVVGNMAYLEDQPGHAKPWFGVDLDSGQTQVPSQAMAEALNEVADIRAGDCRWNERLAAIDPAGNVKVTRASRDGVTLSVPTDAESQGPKNSGSARNYQPSIWVLDADGRPVSYRSPNGSRVVFFSNWGPDPITAPPATQIRH